MPIRWAYGVTTVPERRHDLLPRTLASLAWGGFDKPRLFVDGCGPEHALSYTSFNLPITVRYDALKTAGNWVLALYELYYRNPESERFALFQDDLVTYRNLRKYLERCVLPDAGYWNLYTFPSNQSYCPPGCWGWYESRPVTPHAPQWQSGRGAVALVFSRAAVITLLSQRSLVERVQDGQIKDRKIDGGIVNAMNLAGYREYVHNPSLVQHTGEQSTMGNLPHPQAQSFLGEDYDALSLAR